MATEFQYPLTILEKHLDTFGHVNNASYLELYEEARWGFITENGFGLDKIMSEKKGPVVLDLNLTFKRELKNRQKVVIKSQFKEMKNKLVGVMIQSIHNEEGKIASTLELSVGFMDLKQRKLTEPTEEWFKAIGAPEYFSQN